MSPDSRLTVALPTSTFLPALGGVEVGLHRIATGLLARGHHPIVFTAPQHVARCREIGWHLPYQVIGFPARSFGLLRRWPAAGYWWLDRFFDSQRHRHQIDVWHATVGYPIGVAIAHYSEAYCRVAHLVRCCGEDIQVDATIDYGVRLDPAIDREVRRWLPKAQALVAITESVADEYRALDVPAGRIHSIPNGVDVVRFDGAVDRTAVRHRLRVPPDATMVLTVGRNHPKKNYGLLVDVAARLRQTGRDACFVVIGRNAANLRPEADLAGVTDMFRLIESVGENGNFGAVPPALPTDELVDIYRSADIFLFPSRIETFGIVLVEAMAAGLPIITSDVPGCRDIVRCGQDGAMVDPARPELFLDELIRVIDDKDRRRELSTKARQRARDFDWDKVIDRYLELYQELIRDVA